MGKDQFDELEPRSLIVIGDQKGQVKACGGLLIDIMRDPKYKDKVRYLLVFKDGEEYELAGNAALSQRISAKQIGCIIKVWFEGWDSSGGNRSKVIKVRSCKRENTSDELKEMFPRWHDFDGEEQASAESDKPTAADQKKTEEDIGF